MIQPGMEVDLSSLARSFGALEDGVRRRVARKVTGFAMTPVLKDARGRVQKRTGFTSENLRKKTKVYQGGEISVTLVGVDKSARVTLDGRTHQPAFIERLLHEGFIHARSGQFVPGTQFAKKALESKRPDVERRVIQKLDREIKKEVQKARSRA